MRRTWHICERRMWSSSHCQRGSTSLRQEGRLMPASRFLRKWRQGPRHSLMRFWKLNLIIDNSIPFGFQSTLAV